MNISESDVLRRIQNYRDTGQDLNETTQIALKWLLDVGYTQVSKLGVRHWYCDRILENDEVPSTEVDFRMTWQEVRVFLVRLMSFAKKGQVEEWMNILEQSLLHCEDCVCGWERSKENFKEQYLEPRYSTQTVDEFWTAIQQKEISRLLSVFLSDSMEPKSLFELPCPIVLHIFLIPDIFLRHEIQDSIIASLSSHEIINDRILYPAILPGYLCYALHTNQLLRSFVSNQLQLNIPKRDDIRLIHFLQKAIENVISYNFLSSDSSLLIPRYVTDKNVFWKSFRTVVATLPRQLLNSKLSLKEKISGRETNIMHMMCSNLGDEGHHLGSTIICWTNVLQRLEVNSWDNEDNDYPQVVLDTLLDNPAFGNLAFAEIAATMDSSSLMELSCFSWIMPFLYSISVNEVLFVPCLKSIAQVLLVRYQGGHVDLVKKALFVSVTLSIFSQVLLGRKDKVKQALGWSDDSLLSWNSFTKFSEGAASDVLDVFAPLLVQRAYETTPTEVNASEGDPELQTLLANVALEISSFLEQMMLVDSRRYCQTIYSLADYQKVSSESESMAKNAPTATPSFSLKLWDQAYDSARTTLSHNQRDYQVHMTLVRGLVPAVHLTNLSTRSWKLNDHSILRQTYAVVNNAFKKMHVPLAGVLFKLSDEEPESLRRNFLSQPSVPEAIIAAIFSPVEDIHNASLSIVRQSHDAISRSDCFEQLFAYYPTETLRGINDAIQHFFNAASKLPESSQAAKRVVRCLTDIVDLACDPTQGFLGQKAWLKRDNRRSLIKQLWGSMCKTIALIFKQTPNWAPHYENDEMTGWMRDAIIFADLLQSKVRSFEVAVLQESEVPPESSEPSANGSPSKLSKTGRSMIEALNDPLETLIAWLRLTDTDLLHMSAKLLQSFIQRLTKAEIPVNETVVRKLERLILKGNSKSYSNKLVLSLAAEMSEHPLHQGHFLSLLKMIKGDSGSADDTDDVLILQDQKKPVKPRKSEEKQKSLKSSPTKDLKLESFLKPSEGKGQSLPASGLPSKQPKPSTEGGINFGTAPMSNGIGPSAPKKRLVYSHAKHQEARERIGSQSESSDEESDNDHGKGIAGLVALANASKAPKIKQDTAKRTMAIQDPALLRRSRATRIRQNNNELNARLRSSPTDFAPLYRRLLQWNINHNGNAPPDYTGRPKDANDVQDGFKGTTQYTEYFKSLIMIECWAGLLQAKEDLDIASKDPIHCTIAQRSSVDDFIEVSLSVDGGKMLENSQLSESCIAILRQVGTKKGLLANVQSIVRKRSQTDIVLRCHLASDRTGASHALAPRSRWEVIRLQSLTTHLRSWAAVNSLAFYNLAEDIINPRLEPIPKISPDKVNEYVSKYKVNEPQASAIAGSLQTPGFSLIQGPPGTGKTKTIVGLVSALLSQRSNAKVLLCAPSNAAVDEVARRLKEVVVTDAKLGGRRGLKIVRIGVEESINVSVRDISLDELVERELNGDATQEKDSSKISQDITVLRNRIDKLKTQRLEKQTERNECTNNFELGSKLDFQLQEIKRSTNDLSTQLQELLDKRVQSDRRNDASRRVAREKIMSSAQVICSTLTGAGHDIMSQLPFDFDTVIIDEAAQSVQVDSLIPLKYGCQRCVMVGDPNQLPPTVLSPIAKSLHYDESLFVRLQKFNPHAVHLLSIQYRMHPDISHFPSKHFYDARLQDGPRMAETTKRPWHENSLYPPYSFLDVSKGGAGEEVSRAGHSKLNRTEAEVVLALYTRLRHDYPDINFDYRIGVVTPYKGQVGELKRQFRNKFREDILSKVDFNTVDGFQGQEKAIIILSCVRGSVTGQNQDIGFLKDFRRMNVGLTRAISSLFIVGNAVALAGNPQWRPLIEDARERGLFKEVTGNTYAIGRPPIVPAVENGKSQKKKKRNRSDKADENIDPGEMVSSADRSHDSQMGKVSKKQRKKSRKLSRKDSKETDPDEHGRTQETGKKDDDKTETDKKDGGKTETDEKDGDKTETGKVESTDNSPASKFNVKDSPPSQPRPRPGSLAEKARQQASESAGAAPVSSQARCSASNSATIPIDKNKYVQATNGTTEVSGENVGRPPEQRPQPSEAPQQAPVTAKSRPNLFIKRDKKRPNLGTGLPTNRSFHPPPRR